MPHYADPFDTEAAFTAAIEATERMVAALRERAAGELTSPTGADGVRHGRVEPGHVRDLSTTLGHVAVRRLALRAPGRSVPMRSVRHPTGLSQRLVCRK
jgi:hypothetical protein